MKNLISYLFIVFTLFSFSYAQAQDCETAGKVKLSELKYVGTDLKPLLRKGGACTVVKARTDNEGQVACGKNRAALNPGNPQYTGTNEHGSRMNNELGYYFCVGMNKREMCGDRVRELSSTMDIEWVQLGKGRNDGDCVCRKKGDTTSKMMSCPVTEEQVDALKVGNTTGCSVSGAKDDGGGCKCIIGGALVGPLGSCPQDPPREVTENVDDAELDECIADIKAAKQACSENGKAAIDKCSKEAPEINKNIGEAQRVLSIGLDAVIAKNAGSGALNACAKMGAAGTAVIEGLSFLKENCKKELNNCKKGCEDIGTLSKKSDAVYIDECKAKFAEANPPKAWTTAHEDRLKTLVAAQRDVGSNAEKFCRGDVQKSEGELDGFLQDLASSVQKADICKCQLTSSSNGTSCEDVANPLTCIQNVNQPGCSFSSVGCSPGSTLPGCRNPVNATNPNGSGIAMPASGFAGPGFASGGGSANPGKVGLGSDDFGGLYDETRPSGSGTATADMGSPFGAAAGSGGMGGGGGGGGGGGSGEGGGAAGEGSEKGGLSGLFQSAKGGIASLFGGAPGDKGTAAKKPDNKAYKNDVNGFRPKAGVRGVAADSPFGTKNRDIWKTMNERYNNEYHTFITVENPSK